MDLNELKNEQIKEDKIEKLIESFQKRVNASKDAIQFHRKVDKRHEKEKTFSMRQKILFKKLKQFRELNYNRKFKRKRAQGECLGIRSR